VAKVHEVVTTSVRTTGKKDVSNQASIGEDTVRLHVVVISVITSGRPSR
jgi:hypothetical protein